MIELKDDDINFEEEVGIIEDYNWITAYILETDNLDKLFGIYNNEHHNEDYQVNYYGIYDFESDKFYLNCNVTIYCKLEELGEKYPDIYEELIYINQNEKNIYISETYDFVFDKFKEYCLKSFKASPFDIYDCSNFDNLIKSIKFELIIDKTEEIDY